MYNHSLEVSVHCYNYDIIKNPELAKNWSELGYKVTLFGKIAA